MFKDRTDAGIQLAEKLEPYKGKNAVVLTVPRGGLPIGAKVATALEAELDVVFIKKIGHPSSQEYAIGAVSLDNVIINNPYPITDHYIQEEVRQLRSLLLRRQKAYYKTTKPIKLKDRIVLLVDDGIATGNTLLATVELIHKQQPKQVVVAVPVASPSSIKKLRQSPYVDEVIALLIPDNFSAVGQFYHDFSTVTDEDAISTFETFKKQ
jgi:predicted phosphoribosyltransferase